MQDERPLAYITGAWQGKGPELAQQIWPYCRAVYEAGFSPICPRLYLPFFLDDTVPLEHEDATRICNDMLRRCHVLIVCGKETDDVMMNEIALAQRLNITATKLSGILTVKRMGTPKGAINNEQL